MSGKLSDAEWLECIKRGEDAGWKPVWERVIVPVTRNSKSAELMRRYSLTDGDLMGMLYDEMIGRKKIELFRGEGSLEGWLKRYVNGFILNANPNAHGEISLENANPDAEDGQTELEIPVRPGIGIARNEVWQMTHLCFRDLWNEDPERAYIHLLKTRFFLSSEEIRDFLDVSSAANVDQIFSRSVKFMRAAWKNHEPKWE